jgi:biotin operon repressor
MSDDVTWERLKRLRERLDALPPPEPGEELRTLLAISGVDVSLELAKLLEQGVYVVVADPERFTQNGGG